MKTGRLQIANCKLQIEEVSTPKGLDNTAQGRASRTLGNVVPQNNFNPERVV